MKNLASIFGKTLMALAILSSAFGFAIAQGSFEGSVSYAIRVTGKDAQAFLENEPPKKMDLHVKEGNFIISLSGGRIGRTMLFIADSNETYIIDAANRRAFKETYYLDTVKTVPTAIATGKTVEIKGIPCKEYVVDKPKLQEKIYYYVNDQYRVDMALYAGKIRSQNRLPHQRTRRQDSAAQSHENRLPHHRIGPHERQKDHPRPRKLPNPRRFQDQKKRPEEVKSEK
jgi:hypothetical protein